MSPPGGQIGFLVPKDAQFFHTYTKTIFFVQQNFYSKFNFTFRPKIQFCSDFAIVPTVSPLGQCRISLTYIRYSDLDCTYTYPIDFPQNRCHKDVNLFLRCKRSIISFNNKTFFLRIFRNMKENRFFQLLKTGVEKFHKN